MSEFVPFTGYSSTVSVNDGASSAQVVFPNVINVKLPFGKVDIITYATLAQSTKDKLKIAAMVDGDNFEFTAHYSAATVTRLAALKGVTFITGTTYPTWNVVTSDGTPKTYSFKGLIANVEVGELTNDAIPLCKVTIAISGAITIT